MDTGSKTKPLFLRVIAGLMSTIMELVLSLILVPLIHVFTNQSGHNIAQQEACANEEYCEERWVIFHAEAPIPRSFYLVLDAEFYIFDHWLCEEDFFILKVNEAYHYEFNDSQQNHHHIFLFSLPVKAVEADEPGPASGEEDKTDHQ